MLQQPPGRCLQGRYICLLVKKEAAKHRVEKITASDGILASYQSMRVIFARPPAVWTICHLHPIPGQVWLELEYMLGSYTVGSTTASF